MESIFRINPELNIPIYQQLVDAIRAAVKRGELTSGQKLPTVQELSESLSIARGTIKRAYDELEREGILEKVQGRGTFICYQPVNSGSRKELAMAAIDKLLADLEGMGLSAAEINIFLNLKLRERAEEEAFVKIAVVECNPETLTQMADQLRHIKGVNLYSYLLESVQQYPYKLAEDFDLIVTTAEHAEFVEGILPVPRKIARVALRPSTQMLSSVIKLRPGEKVGALSHSQRFGLLLQRTLKQYAEETAVETPTLLEGNVGNYLAGLDAVLVPKDYEKYCTVETARLLDRFAGQRIDCYYKMDEGSLLYLEAKIKRLLEEKTI